VQRKERQLSPEGLCFPLPDRLVEPVGLMTSQTTTRGSVLGSTSLFRIQTGPRTHPVSCSVAAIACVLRVTQPVCEAIECRG